MFFIVARTTFRTIDPDHITDVTANSHSARKTLLGRHLYIIKAGKTYSVDGKRTDPL